MKPNSLSKVAIGTLLFSIGLGAGFFAQTLTDSPQRVEHKRGDLAGAPDMEVIVSTAEYKPGESIDLHLHHGAEAVYVIHGREGPGSGQGRDPDHRRLVAEPARCQACGLHHRGRCVVEAVHGACRGQGQAALRVRPLRPTHRIATGGSSMACC